MNACIIQPPYSRDVAYSDEYFTYKLNLLEQCDETIDLIVLPEYSDVPCATTTSEETIFYHKKYIENLLETCKNTAMRCQALVFVNALSEEAGEYRNTTFVFNQAGEVIGKYYKKHLPPFETETLQLASDYTHEFSEPYILDIDGLRYGFLTCYDFYFYEAYANIAQNKVDIIIGCSLQRSDSHDAIEMMCRFLAYNTNAYVLRSSVSFSEESTICGASMVVSPYGTVLENMKGRFGMMTVEFEPKDKHLKPAGYGNPDKAHYEYIECGRQPWQYRPAGSAIVKTEALMSYPRVCAHRGFNTIAPENSMPAFGAAIALGADEIEFDLWPTKDGEIVSIHDEYLDRVSDGAGKVHEHTLEELQKLDFGKKFSEKFQGLRIVMFEEILKKFGCHTIMNIHVKGFKDQLYPRESMEKIVALIRKYDCAKHVYFMISQDCDVKLFQEYASDIPICLGHDFDRPWAIVDRAIELGVQKVQFFKPWYNKEMVDRAHKHGLICNIFWSDDPKEAKEFVEMGMDTILTNDFQLVAQSIKTV